MAPPVKSDGTNADLGELPPAVAAASMKVQHESVTASITSGPAKPTMNGRWKLMSITARAVGSFLLSPIRGILNESLRPTWNPRFETYVSIMRSALSEMVEDIGACRILADRSVPGFILASGVHRYKEKVYVTPTHQVKCEWIWPSLHTPGHKRRLSKEIPTSFPEMLSKRPVVLYLHGGGFSLCSTGSHRGLLFQLAASVDVPIYAPNYRRPPDVEISHTVKDALVALNRMEEVYGVKRERIVIMGDSAGGNLAVLTMLELKKRNEPLPGAAVLLCPWVDLSVPGDAENAPYDYLPPDRISIFAKIAAGKLPLTDPLVSPQYADLTGLPPMLIHAGECEVLKSQIVKFAEKAKNEGLDCKLQVYTDMVHVFHMFAFCHQTPNQAFTDIKQFIDTKIQ
jgi:epsilon-lactone hydrolase